MNPSDSYIGAAAIAVASAPLILKLVPPNPWYGFRTPSTLRDPSVWYRANAFAGWALFLASIAGAAWIWAIDEGILPAMGPDVLQLTLPLMVAVVASFVYLRRIRQDA